MKVDFQEYVPPYCSHRVLEKWLDFVAGKRLVRLIKLKKVKKQ